jgi:hypothetical protein
MLPRGPAVVPCRAGLPSALLRLFSPAEGGCTVPSSRPRVARVGAVLDCLIIPVGLGSSSLGFACAWRWLRASLPFQVLRAPVLCWHLCCFAFALSLFVTWLARPRCAALLIPWLSLSEATGLGCGALGCGSGRAYRLVFSGLPFVPLSVKSFGRLGAPALTLPQSLADHAVQAGGTAFFWDACVSGALRALSIVLRWDNASLGRSAVHALTRVAFRQATCGL